MVNEKHWTLTRYLIVLYEHRHFTRKLIRRLRNIIDKYYHLLYIVALCYPFTATKQRRRVTGTQTDLTIIS